nr:hypothetical protein [Robbsia andropogonis]
MVRAILDGRKTQTRRVVKLNVTGRAQRGKRQWHIDDPDAVLACPYGQPGDRLWVRETWRGIVDINPPDEPLEFSVARYVPEQKYCRRVEYLATHDRDGKLWRPPLHMPRWASRILLEITDVRVERLQNCTQSDAVDEGIERSRASFMPHGFRLYDKPGNVYGTDPIESYRSLWDILNAARGYGWDTNPWVWIVSFKRIEP